VFLLPERKVGSSGKSCGQMPKLGVLLIHTVHYYFIGREMIE